MRFIIELDGPVMDIVPASHATHRAVAADVGWSALDLATFRRITRKDGRQANILPGARPGKVEDYHDRYALQIESGESVAAHPPQANTGANLAAMSRFGTCCGVALGANIDARRRWIESNGLGDHLAEAEALCVDPRRRPAELRVLSGGDERTMVIAASEGVLRAAGGADLFAIGMDVGLTSKKRLFRAGAAVVYGGLGDLLESLSVGCPDLVQAGLLPLPMTAEDT